MSDAILIRAKAMPFGFINVTYTAGSTLKCTNGDKTLVAEDTSGSWVFAVPKGGNWTVTSTKGNTSKSATVTLTTRNEVKSISLVNELWLYNAGNQYSGVTGGWKRAANGSGNGTVTFNSNNITVQSGGNSGTLAMTNWAIDLTNVSTLHFSFADRNSGLLNGQNRYVGVYTSNNGSGNSVASATIQAWAYSAALNVANVKGSYYIGVGVYQDYGVGGVTVQLTQCYGKA